MTSRVAKELVQVVDRVAGNLSNLSPQQTRQQPAPGKWSIQQIIGHLLDSAANNHHRFIRAQQIDPFAFPGYEQDHWVRAQNYNQLPWPDLLQLWKLYNRHLAHVIEAVPSEKLTVECRIGSYPTETLSFLIEDYLAHIEHHLKQIDAIRASFE